MLGLYIPPKGGIESNIGDVNVYDPSDEGVDGN
jgi:hypothetical protein